MTNIYRKSLVITVFYQLTANDDQGAKEPIRSRKYRRILSTEGGEPTCQEMEDAKKHASILIREEMGFRHAGAYLVEVTNALCTLEIVFY